MELKVGSKCSFAHEKGKPKEWYAFLDEKYGYNLQGCKGGAVAVQNGRLVAYMLECLGVKDGRTVTITIGSEPTSFNLDRNALWPLITAAIKQ